MRINKDDRNNPQVAVIVACYNHGRYMEQCLTSIQQQDYKEKFAVVIDDCSTDDSWVATERLLDNVTDVENQEFGFVVCGFFKDMPVFLLKNEKNLKQAASRNKGIKFAWEKAYVFGMLDADDIYLESKITKSVNIILESPNVIGLVYSDVLIQDDRNGRIVHEFREPYTRERIEQECIVSNAPLITKLALETVGLYDEDLPPCEDWDLWIRITERFCAVHIPEPLQLYHVTGFNCTYTVPKEKWQEQWTKVRQKLINRIYAKQA